MLCSLEEVYWRFGEMLVTSPRLHDVTFRNIILSTVTAVWTWSLTTNKYVIPYTAEPICPDTNVQTVAHPRTRFITCPLWENKCWVTNDPETVFHIVVGGDMKVATNMLNKQLNIKRVVLWLWSLDAGIINYDSKIELVVTKCYNWFWTQPLLRPKWEKENICYTISCIIFEIIGKIIN